MRFDVAVTGSGGLEVARVAADNLFVSLLGSGRIAVGGAAEKLTAAISGSGDFDARALTVEQAEVNRSEEHTSELPSLMRISYAVFCLKKKNIITNNNKK